MSNLLCEGSAYSLEHVLMLDVPCGTEALQLQPHSNALAHSMHSLISATGMSPRDGLEVARAEPALRGA